MSKFMKIPMHFSAVLLLLCMRINFTGCKKEIIPLYCDNGFIPNKDETECICPEPEYFLFQEIGSDGSLKPDWCVKRAGIKYRVSFEDSNCIHQYFEHYEKEGIAVFDFNKSNGRGYIELEMGAPYGKIGGAGNTGFQDVRVTERPDGGIDVSFLFVPWGFITGCHDWAERTGCHLAIGRGNGFSTPDRKRFEFKIDWYEECTDTYLDSGIMRMW